MANKGIRTIVLQINSLAKLEINTLCLQLYFKQYANKAIIWHSKPTRAKTFLLHYSWVVSDAYLWKGLQGTHAIACCRSEGSSSPRYTITEEQKWRNRIRTSQIPHSFFLWQFFQMCFTAEHWRFCAVYTCDLKFLKIQNK